MTVVLNRPHALCSAGDHSSPPLDGITAWLKQIKVGSSGYVFVIDHTGTVAAHPQLNLQDRQYDEYPAVAPMQEVLRGRPHTAEYLDPLAQRPMVATFMPLSIGGEQRWVVVAERRAPPDTDQI